MASKEVTLAISKGTTEGGMSWIQMSLSFDEVVRLIEECRVIHLDIEQRKRAANLLKRMSDEEWTVVAEGEESPPDIHIRFLATDEIYRLVRNPGPWTDRADWAPNPTGKVLRIGRGPGIKLEPSVSDGGIKA